MFSNTISICYKKNLKSMFGEKERKREVGVTDGSYGPVVSGEAKT